MPDNKPEPAQRRNGLVMLAEAEPAARPQSIREYLDSCPTKSGHGVILGDCAKHGISLDSPWPPRFPDSGPGREPERSLAQPPAARVLQFPLPFGDDTRAVSNAMARSALFAPVKERAFFKDYVVVGEIDGCLVEWKGEQLNQDDHDTLLQLVAMARCRPFGVDVVQAVNAILAGLGRHNHKEQRRQLFEQCDRLMAGTIRITPRGGPSYAGHLINDIVTPQDQKTEPRHRRFLSYQLNPKLAPFYHSAAFTLVDTSEELMGRHQ